MQELHQGKHIKADVDLKYYNQEHSKASGNRDLFILFTTHNSSIAEQELPPRGGLVSKANFNDYFGPFAARAFREYKVDINKASRSQLDAVSGIGPKTADIILKERNLKPFQSREDFMQRTGIKRTFSDAFYYSGTGSK